jgi:hypothetical protein
MVLASPKQLFIVTLPVESLLGDLLEEQLHIEISHC